MPKIQFAEQMDHFVLSTDTDKINKIIQRRHMCVLRFQKYGV